MEILDAYNYFDVLERVNGCDPDPKSRADFLKFVRGTPEFQVAYQSLDHLGEHIKADTMSLGEMVVEAAFTNRVPFANIRQIDMTSFGSPIWELATEDKRYRVVPVRENEPGDFKLAKSFIARRFCLTGCGGRNYFPIIHEEDPNLTQVVS